ncbi:mannose-specific lectin-like [Aristolochia californica]|uniref:mannose-specific lectin-like n=1 Tax=Aristolochia californica TaxID=171875 RepID=UPI0035D8BE20
MASLRIGTIVVLLALTVFCSEMAVGEDLMFSGESLNTNEFLENGQYRFIMQGDCNLVLYLNRTRALWNSGTNGRGTSCRATLQTDGNLVILSGSSVVWSSGTAIGSNNYRLIVQGDGNVVIYGRALWATNTVQSRKRL